MSPRMSEEGYQMMGAAFEVHNFLGGGLSEEIYHQSLQLEFQTRNIPYESKKLLPVSYKGVLLSTQYVPDFLVYGEIVLELKSVKSMTDDHLGQLMNYMRISGKSVGYLINFAPIGKLDYERVVI